MPTKIEWCDETWNPVSGCTKVSEGCRNCYAEAMAKRFWGKRKFTDVRCHPERLDIPARWKNPRLIFVNSMSDLFHPDVPVNFIGEVISKIAINPQYKFLILTKRPDRMAELFTSIQFRAWVQFNAIPDWDSAQRYYNDDDSLIIPNFPIRDWDFHTPESFIIPNLWLGVSVENQETAEDRIPFLLQTPAAVRFVSIEPMLGLVDIEKYLVEDYDGALSRECEWEPPDRDDWRFHSLDWVICGGETGPHARPMHPDWVRSLRDQCQDAKIPFFFKSWGEWLPAEYIRVGDPRFKRIDKYEYHTFKKYEEYSTRVGKKNAGRLLDGREWNEYPKCQEIKRLQEKLNAR